MKHINRLTLMITMLIIICFVYATPYILTWSIVGKSILPPNFSPDVYLYLNISKSITNGAIPINPWLGSPIDTTAVGYYLFDTPFLLFGELLGLFSNDTALAMFCWQLFWVAFTFLGASLFYLALSKESKNTSVLIFMLCSTFFVNFGAIQQLLESPFSLLFDGSLLGPGLPNYRAFYPQVCLPFVFLFLWNMCESMVNEKRCHFLIAIVTQFCCFLTFPYSSAYIIASAFIFMLLLPFKFKNSLNIFLLSTTLILCLVIDIIYLVLNKFPLSGKNGAGGFSINFTQFHLLGSATLWAIFLFACTLVFLGLRYKNHALLLAAGLGLAQSILLCADIFTPPELLSSIHFAYFTQVTISILLSVTVFFVISKYKSQALVATFNVLSILAFVQGVLSATYVYKSNEHNNFVNFEIEGIARSQFLPGDLVVAPANFVDAPADWLPLSQKGNVLYSKDMEILESRSRDGTIENPEYYERKALHLFLLGYTVDKIQDGLHTYQQTGKGIYDIATIIETQRLDVGYLSYQEFFEGIERTLIPAIGQPTLKHNADKLLSKYKNIYLIDYIKSPLFDAAAINKIVNVERCYKGKYISVFKGHARK
jgi:hypothetical protein